MRALVRLLLERYRLDPRGTHGVHHWGRVLENARRLSRSLGLSEAHARVAEHFAVFHDACREEEGWDPDHGPRASLLVDELRAVLDLEDGGLALLKEACSCHTRGARPGASLVVRLCLDADRLDIPRVGIHVRVGFLSTKPAREPAMLRWSSDRALSRAAPEVASAEWGWEPEAR